MAEGLSLPNFAAQLALQVSAEMQEEEEEEEEYPDGEEEEGDEDAEAAEIARRLGDQLMADIAKAQAEQVAAAAAAQTQEPGLQSSVIPPTTPAATSDPAAAAISTMRSILAHATKDPLVNFVLASASVIDPIGTKTNALQILQRSAEVGFIPQDLAKIFSPVVLQLSQSEALFGSKNTIVASTPIPETGKRKRDDFRAQIPSISLPDGPRTTEVQDILAFITPAVQVISSTLSIGELPLQNDTALTPLTPALISSIQVPLHQVFLFAVTTAPSVVQPQGSTLQEIGGLIQMLGVLSGINIGPGLQQPSLETVPHDLSTAVYPCLVPACHKTFSRLYSLRSHQRNHSTHPTARPYQCPRCPASFARNHDLKRHAKLHGSKAYKCSGCDKIFSRRDAIKRHMNSSRLKTESHNPSQNNIVLGRKEEAERCRDAEVIEVEVARESGSDELKEEKRAKSWGDKLASAAQDGPPGPSSGAPPLEEGEIPSYSVAEAQKQVSGLFPLLSRYVAYYAPRPSDAMPSDDPTRTVAGLMAGQSWNQGPNAMMTNVRSEAIADQMLSSLSLPWLSPEQTKQLEDAIAAAAKSAQEQAEAEAALEEEEEDREGEDDDMEEVEPTA